MSKQSLHFRLGENMGEILLDIAQNKITKGDFDGAIAAYTDSLCGFTKEYALMVLKNQAVLRVSADGCNITMTDDPQAIEANRDNMRDWNLIVREIITDIQCVRRNITELRDSCNICLNDYCLTRYLEVDPHTGEQVLAPLGTLVARHLAGHDIVSNPNYLGLNRVLSIGDDNLDELNTNERNMYCIIRYFDAIKILHSKLILLDKIYHSLKKYGMIEHVPFIEDEFENSLYNYLEEFYDTEKGYHHVMCDGPLIKLKEQMEAEMKQTVLGAEYFQNKVIAKDILDGYDAGFLAPDGKFYGLNGHENELLHVQLVDMLVRSGSLYSNVSALKSDAEYSLMNKGLMKIHHDKVYGFYAYDMEDADNGVRLWCPTKIQITMIYKYANKFYGGVINTDSTGYNEVHVSALRQMDEIALRNAFRV